MDIIEAPKKKIRASRPKTKTGCKTCRIRRVKCDEAKPSCLRCEKFGIQCDGYIIPPVRRIKFESVKVQPQAQLKPHLSPKRNSNLPWESLVQLPEKRLFASQGEYQYFQLFLNNLIPRTATHLDFDLWNSLIREAVQRDTSVQNVIIALAALESTWEIVLVQGVRTLRQSSQAQKHHLFAVEQYNKAIQGMRKAAIEGEQELNIRLITCIFTICFESYYGNADVVRTISELGLDIVKDHLAENTASTKPLREIDEELLYAVGKLDVQTRTSGLIRRPKDYSIQSHLTQTEDLPLMFSSLKEAKYYLGIRTQKLIQFLMSVLPPVENERSVIFDVSRSIPEEVLGEREKHLHNLQEWHEACYPILENARTPSGSQDFLGAAALKLQYLTSYFHAASMRSACQPYTKLGNFMPLFEEIVSTSECLLQHENLASEKGPFMFEIQIVGPLFCVAWRCPQRTLRRKALSLLREWPRRELLWDSVGGAEMATFVMELEEERFEGEYAPDEVRSTGLDILEYSMATRRTRIRCLMPEMGTGQIIAHEKVLSWG